MKYSTGKTAGTATTHSDYRALISIPFSFNDLSVGSGGTLPTHALAIRPPKEIWQVAQSPLTIKR